MKYDENKIREATIGRGPSATGKRNITWRTDGAGLSYMEQEPKPKKSDTCRSIATGGRQMRIIRIRRILYVQLDNLISCANRYKKD